MPPRALPEPLNEEDGFTRLLLRLPPELRIKIYEYCFGPIPIKLHTRSSEHDLRWLDTSRTIFDEAAPILYAHTVLCFDLEPGSYTHPSRMNPWRAMERHIGINFKADRKRAEEKICGSLVKKVVLEVWCDLSHRR